jgi:hypothetical protein
MTTAELESKILAMEAEIAVLKERLELKERLDRAELDVIVRRGDAQFARGEGIPAQTAIEMLRRKHNIPTQ